MPYALPIAHEVAFLNIQISSSYQNISSEALSFVFKYNAYLIRYLVSDNDKCFWWLRHLAAD